MTIEEQIKEDLKKYFVTPEEFKELCSSKTQSPPNKAIPPTFDFYVKDTFFPQFMGSDVGKWLLNNAYNYSMEATNNHLFFSVDTSKMIPSVFVYLKKIVELMFECYPDAVMLGNMI